MTGCHWYLQEGRSTTGANFAAGTVAAVAATLVTQPADVIRTRMQLVGANGAHIGPVQTLKVAMSTGGAQALLVGTLPRVRSASACQVIMCESQWSLGHENICGTSHTSADAYTVELLHRI